jgi:hypothetical protein
LLTGLFGFVLAGVLVERMGLRGVSGGWVWDGYGYKTGLGLLSEAM